MKLLNIHFHTSTIVLMEFGKGWIISPTFRNGCNYLSIWKLAHWGRVAHIYVRKLNIIGSDNGLWPGRRQAIIWINAGILLIEPLGTNFSEILFEMLTFSSNKMHLKMSSAKWRPFCFGLNVLINVDENGPKEISTIRGKRRLLLSTYQRDPPRSNCIFSLTPSIYTANYTRQNLRSGCTGLSRLVNHETGT